MARSARDKPREPDDRPSPPVVASKSLAQRMVTYTQSPIPVRTVILLEVGDLPPEQVRVAVAQVRKIHGESLHPTFVQPVRYGKLTGDVLFEREIMELVDAVCEVVDGKIVLRGGPADVDIMRVRL